MCACVYICICVWVHLYGCSTDLPTYGLHTCDSLTTESACSLLVPSLSLLAILGCFLVPRGGFFTCTCTVITSLSLSSQPYLAVRAYLSPAFPCDSGSTCVCVCMRHSIRGSCARLQPSTADIECNYFCACSRPLSMYYINYCSVPPPPPSLQQGLEWIASQLTR